MKTTRYDAEALYEIGNYIDPYASCQMDKKEEMEALMSQTLEDNIKYLQEYICEGYDSVLAIIEDDGLLRRYLNILRRLKRNDKR